MSGVIAHDLAGEEGSTALEALAHSASEAGIHRSALLLHLSALPPELAQPHHLRLAREALAPLTVADRARRFALPNGDLVLVWRGHAPALEGVLAALRHLYAGVELPGDKSGLIELLPLPAATDRLLEAIDESRLPRPAPSTGTAGAGRELDLRMLAALEAALARADMARFARRRPVCAWTEGGFVTRWEHRMLSLRELAEELAPEHDLHADAWLLRRLTRTLDRRLLALLVAPGELRSAGPLGFDLNVASLLGPDFLRFDAALPPALRGQVTLTLDLTDAVADPAAFLFARDFARSRKYRVVLGGIEAGSLPALSRHGFGVALLRLAWSPTLAALDPACCAELADVVLLSGVDDKEALSWGRAAGVALFQGALAAPATRSTA